MSFRCLSLIFVAVLPRIAAEQRVVRVCADPNNMPFSNERGEGFENKLAEMIAAKVVAKLEYTWWSERKSFSHHDREFVPSLRPHSGNSLCESG